MLTRDQSGRCAAPNSIRQLAELILTFYVPYAVSTGAVSYQLKKAGVTLERRAALEPT